MLGIVSIIYCREVKVEGREKKLLDGLELGFPPWPWHERSTPPFSMPIPMYTAIPIEWAALALLLAAE